jgi:hypothetical protein
MTWSVDAAADDWTHINAGEIARRAISRLESRGKGVLLLHDIHEKTALALPVILKELKARGFKIVHVVPATPDRPRTVSEPEQWAAHAAPAHRLWPAAVAFDIGAASRPVLAAPNPRNLGVLGDSGQTLEVNLARSLMPDAAVPLPTMTPWPRGIYSAPTGVSSLPVPAAQNFRYTRAFETSQPGRKAVVVRKRTAPSGPHTTTLSAPGRPVARGITKPAQTGSQAGRPPYPFGHQL